MRRLAGWIVAMACLAGAAPASASITSVFNGDVSCAVQGNGVRFCGSNAPRSTTKTFDGVPIDVNAAFPPEPASGPDGPYPLVIIGHGYGGSKLGLSTMQPWLDTGYATVSMTDRGFHESCGSAASRAADPAGCAAGYIRLMDDRYEVRDAQLFAGELVDQGLVEPTKVAAIGGSYGGGLSMALAALKDRTMMPDSSLVPWTSPNGTPMSLAAAAPNIPWTNLAYSLMPNGSTLDYVDDAPYAGDPGIEKKSLVDGLYLLGCLANFCAPAGSDPDADITGWKNRIDQGEPYVGDPMIADVLDEVQAHHSSYSIDHSEPPAPLLISNGFTDDLFPVDEAVRFYNRTKDEYPDAPVALFFGDFGHPRALNKPDVTGKLSNRIHAWLDYYVKGAGAKPFQGVIAMTETCPKEAASGGPFSARNWASLARGELRLSSAAAQTIEPGAGDPAISSAFNPVPGDACATAPGNDQRGVASYRLPAATGTGYTLLGSPTVIARWKSPSSNSQVAARLLDVAPDNTETLVARGLWRPPTGKRFERKIFQLHPGAWRFAAGHVAKLELLPKDEGYGRPSDGQQTVRVSDLELQLPVRDRPGSLAGLVRAPSPRVAPKGYELADEFEGFGSAAAKADGRKLTLHGRKVGVGVSCPAAWVACHHTVVQVGGHIPRGRDFAGTRKDGKVYGSHTRSVSVRLPRSVAKFLETHRSLRARISVRVREQVRPSTAMAKIVAP